MTGRDEKGGDPNAGSPPFTVKVVGLLACRHRPVASARTRLEDEAELLRPGQALLRIVGLDQSLLDQMHPLERPAMRRLNAGALEFLRRLNAVPLNPHARDKVVRLVASCQPLFSADLRPQGNLS